MAILKQKEIIGEAYKSPYAIGSILSTPLSFPIKDCGLSVVLTKTGTETARVQLQNTSGSDLTFSWYRTSVYNGTSEGQYSNSVTLSDGISTTVDDTIYINSNDRISILIGIDNLIYEAFIWCSGQGSTCRIITKQLN